MDISIIIPCYNQGLYLLDAIKSIENLEGKFFYEIIIVNDGSDDKSTLEILNNLSTQNYIIVNQPNSGLASARNLGLKYAIGDFIQFLDADDIIINNKLEHQLSIFRQDSALGVCISDFLFSAKDLKNTFMSNNCQIKCNSEYPVREFLLSWERGFSVPIHCALFKRDICFGKNLNIFDKDLPSREDWLMWCVLALRGIKFKFDHQVCAIYRIHPSSMTRKIVRSIEGYIMAQTKIACLIKDRDLLTEFIVKSAKHLSTMYLWEYKNSIVPYQIIPICYGKFKRLIIKSIKRIIPSCD